MSQLQEDVLQCEREVVEVVERIRQRLCLLYELFREFQTGPERSLLGLDRTLRLMEVEAINLQNDLWRLQRVREYGMAARVLMRMHQDDAEYGARLRSERAPAEERAPPLSERNIELLDMVSSDSTISVGEDERMPSSDSTIPEVQASSPPANDEDGTASTSGWVVVNDGEER